MQEDDDGLEPSADQTDSPPAAQPDEAARLKTENAQLRATNRELHAQALGAKFGLPESVTSLLAGVPKDQQEAKAQELAEAIKAKPPETPGEPKKEPEPEPENADALKAMDSTPTPPETPSVPGSEAEFERRILEAKSFEEMQAIQQDAIRAAKGVG